MKVSSFLAIVVFCFSLISCIELGAQNTQQQDALAVADRVYLPFEIDEQPVFPGGRQIMLQYLNSLLTYPLSAREQMIEGKIIVEFIVAADGSISGAKILKGLGHGCDDEVLRGIDAMPRWKPGLKNNEPVASKVLLPVTFQLTL